MKGVLKTAGLVLVSFLPALSLPSLALAGGLPSIRSQKELNVETQWWVKCLQAAKASGKAVSVFNDGTDESRKGLHGIVGPYIPLDKVLYAWVKSDGTFGMKFRMKHQIDFPLNEGGYIRVKLDDAELHGVLMKARTLDKKIPLKIMVFKEPHTIQIDRLGPDRNSTFPAIGKILGLQPNIVAMVYLERKGKPYAAPMLDGMGASENPKIMKDLLDLDDKLLPERFLAADK